MGDALEANLAESLRWWRQAARQGHGRAQVKLAHAYRWGEGVAENKPLAVAWYRRALEGGELSAAVWLAECLEQGEGVRPNIEEALLLYRRAADAGEAHAMAELGRCLIRGIGTRVQRRRGERYLRQAAELGWTPARTELQRDYYARAVEILADSTEGDPRRAEGVRLLLAAAESGHRQAALLLAHCYRLGDGIEADPQAALIWYGRASTLLDAKIALADMLFFGEAGTARPADALRWYRLAAEQGDDAYAMYSTGYCLLHGIGTASDVRAGVRWLSDAAARDDANAHFELGVLYADGRGSTCNPAKAAAHFKQAAALGHSGARRRLA